MTLFIRTKSNQTIVDCEIWVKDIEGNSCVELSCQVDIEEYSKFLLNNIEHKDQIVHHFGQLQELRGWMWEVYFAGKQNIPEEKDNVIEAVKTMFNQVCEIYGLVLVQD